jgi:hypothetical protein
MPMYPKFINFFMPISVIKEKYPGGFERFLEEYEKDFGIPPHYDEYLFMAGAMSPADIEYIVNYWTNKGFECLAQRNGESYWNDGCVYEELYGGATLPCDWILYNEKERYVFLRGTEPDPESKMVFDRSAICGDEDDAGTMAAHYAKFKPQKPS